jgi:hypothetical protein
VNGTNGLKELLDKFAALTGDSAALWEFYAQQTTPIKIVLWSNFPQFHDVLREEERKELR